MHAEATRESYRRKPLEVIARPFNINKKDKYSVEENHSCFGDELEAKEF